MARPKRSGLLVLALLLVLSGCAGVGSGTARAACNPPDNERRVAGGRECLVARTYRPASPGPAPTLVVFLHGDGGTGGASDYMFRYARETVARGVVAVALLRPGYFDRDGNQSTGYDNGRRDGYGASNVDAVAAAVKVLKAHHGARRVILVGHSGGAAISAVILGRHPGLADAVLVACPCHITHWRSVRGGEPWRFSLSPHHYAGDVPRTARVVAVTGESDGNTFPDLARDYVTVLRRRGVVARFVAVSGAGHDDVMRSGEVRAAIQELVAAD